MWLAIKRCRRDWSGVSTLEREDTVDARVQFFCVFMGIFVCVSRCPQSRCSARERLHDLFLFSGTTQTPPSGLLSPNLSSSSSFLSPASSVQPHPSPAHSFSSLLFTFSWLIIALLLRRLSTLCVYAHKPLSLLPHFQRSSTLLPDLRRGSAHLLITVTHLRPRRLS